MKWYHEQRADSAKWKKLKRWYKANCMVGEVASKKPKSFNPLQYQTSVRVEQQMLKNGVIEMMHEAAFAHWSSKKKNWPPRGLTESEAVNEFRKRLQDAETVVDYRGEHQGYEARIGVRTKTVLTDRDAFIKGQGYVQMDKVVKNVDQETLDKAYARLHTNLQDATGASNQMSARETFAFLGKGSGELGSSAFDGQLASLGGIKALASKVSDSVETDMDDDDGNPDAEVLWDSACSLVDVQSFKCYETYRWVVSLLLKLSVTGSPSAAMAPCRLLMPRPSAARRRARSRSSGWRRS